MTRQMVFVSFGMILVLMSAAALLSPFYIVAPAIPIGVLGLLFLYRFPEWGLVILAGLVPLEGLFAESKLFTGSKLVGIAMLGIVTLKILLKEIPLAKIKSPLWWPIMGLILAFVASALWNGFNDSSEKMIRQLITAVSIFYLTLAVHERIPFNWLMRVLAFSVAVTAFMALVSEGATVEDRAIGLLTDANFFALLLVTVVPITLFLVFYEKEWLIKALWLGILLLLLVGLQKTQSRSGLVVFAFAVLLLGFHYREILRRLSVTQMGLAGVVACLVLVMAIAVMPADYRQRIASLVNLKAGVQSSLEDRSLGRRTSYLVVGMAIFKEKPLLGAGPGSFPFYYAKTGYAPAFSMAKPGPELYRRAHNTYMETLAETGLLGLISLVVLVTLSWRQFLIARKKALQHQQMEYANQVAHFGVALMVVSIFLLFLTGLNHKLFWLLLGLGNGFLHYPPFHSNPIQTNQAQLNPTPQPDCETLE